MEEKTKKAETLSAKLSDIQSKHEMQSDELTSEKSEVKKAKKSKQRSQALAGKRLAQVRDESERANNLHDELAAVLEAKAK